MAESAIRAGSKPVSNRACHAEPGSLAKCTSLRIARSTTAQQATFKLDKINEVLLMDTKIHRLRGSAGFACCGHYVVGLDSDLYANCDLATTVSKSGDPQGLRDLVTEDLEDLMQSCTLRTLE